MLIVNMEFDKDLTKIQGALTSLGNRGLLNSTDTTDTVVSVLKKITENLSDESKSKVTFFMVLNTQLTVSNELKNDENVFLFISITPPIEKNFLIEYLYQLNLHTYLNDVIENCPTVLTLELIEVLFEKLKNPDFHKNEYGVQHIYKFWCSVFTKMWKIENGNHTDGNLSKLIFYFDELYNLIEKVLITSMKINSEQLKYFIGGHLYYLFDSILFFVNLLTKQVAKSDSELYKVIAQLSGSVGQNENTVVCENCVKKIFSSLKNILDFLTVDLWISLSECFLEFDSINSAQLLIGVCIFNLCESEFGIPSDAMNYLSVLKIKPKSESDKISEAQLSDIITNVDEGKKKWFEALIKHNDFTKQDSIECVLRNLTLADSEDVNVILDKLLLHLEKDSKDENLELVKKLFFAAVKMVHEDDYPTLLEKIFVRVSDSFRCDLKEELVETFNKISNERTVPVGDLICLCIQSPEETLKKICEIVVYDPKQTNFALGILKTLKPACGFLHSTTKQRLLDYVLLNSILPQELSIREKRALITLIVQLEVENLIGLDFVQTLLESVKEYSEKQNLDNVVVYLEILKPLTETKIFEGKEIPLLVFMSQILGHFSWDLKSFSTVKSDGTDLIDAIVTSIIKKLNNGCELEWARQEIAKCWEINQAHFCDLWYGFGRKWLGSGQFHSCILALAHSHHESEYLLGFLKDCNDRSSLVLSLVMVLPVLTFNKWNSIFNHLVHFHSDEDDSRHEVLDSFGSSLYFLTISVKYVENVRPCYEHCLRNFGRLVKKSSPEMKPESLTKIIVKIAFILNSIEDEEWKKSCCVILSPVLNGLVDWVLKKDGVELFGNEIEKALETLGDSDVVEAARRKLKD